MTQQKHFNDWFKGLFLYLGSIHFLKFFSNWCYWFHDFKYIFEKFYSLYISWPRVPTHLGSFTWLRSLLSLAYVVRTPNEGLNQTNLKPCGQKRKKIHERRQETCKTARDVFASKQKNSWVRYLIMRGPAAFWMSNF